MNKKDILWGAVMILIVLLMQFRSVTVRAINEIDDLPIINITDFWNNVIVATSTISIVMLLIMGMLDFSKINPTIDSKFDINITIPSHFLLPLIMTGSGGFIILLGKTYWGIGIACLSFPTLMVFLLIGLWKIAKESNMKSDDDLP